MVREVKSTTTLNGLDDKAREILRVSKVLLNLLEDAPGDFVKNNDLLPLYEELIETVPNLQYNIRSGNLEY